MEEYQKTVMRVSTVTLLGNLILAFFKILILFRCFKYSCSYGWRKIIQ